MEIKESPTSQSTCRICTKRIQLGVLRVDEAKQSRFSHASTDKFHAECWYKGHRDELNRLLNYLKLPIDLPEIP